jgi:CubicO group peptidase (beta-lactamase class C family)
MAPRYPSVIGIAAVAVLALPVAAPQAQRPDLSTFDAWVAKGVRDWGVPGLAISIVKDDSVVFARGYGVRRLGSPEPVDAHTLFAIGSTTKAMTSLSLLMLAEEQRVSLSDPVQRYLPGLDLRNPSMARELTVRDLLTHHTGLPGADLLWSGDDYPIEEIIRRLRWLEPASFRSRYAYMNIQYAMAGQVVRAASGVPWGDFVSQRIFGPLGMRESVTSLAATSGRPNVASPHMRIDDTLRVIDNRTVDPVAPAGAIWSSVSDMARWMRFVLDSGRIAGQRLVTERSFVDWLSPQVVIPAADFYPTARLTRPHFINYGLGWFLEDYNGHAVAMHTGSIDGMSAIIGLIPDLRVGVYVLANVDHAELRHALMYRVFDLFSGGATRDWSAELRALYGGLAQQGAEAARVAEATRVKGTRPSLALERYVGTYVDSLYGTLRISLDGSGLRAAFGKGFQGPLAHWHYDTFRARWDDRRTGTSFLTFVLDAGGAPSVARLDADGTPIDFMRTGGSRP